MAYEFTQEGFRTFSEALVEAKGDQATVTSILADMQDTFNDNIGKLTAITQKNEAIKAENERLRSANMDLFLRIGTSKEEIQGESPAQEKSVSTAEYMENYFKKLEEK